MLRASFISWVRHLRIIGSDRNVLSDGVCSQLIHALVSVGIDYCDSLLYDHITETLMDLHWFPVHQRITFKILILTYQAYHGTAPQYLCDLIVPYANTCNLRSNNKLLIAPCHYRKCWGNFQRLTF